MKATLILVCLCASAAAQSRGARPANEIRVQQKLALVIGNGAYSGNPLKNPPNDAAAVARTLRSLGFDDVTERHDLNRRQMRQEVDRFVSRINKDDLAWVYYAGHGVQANERNYLIPIDFTGDEADLDYEAFPADQLRDKLEKSGARLRILVLDACRNNPFRGSKRGGTRGLVHMDSTVEGTYIAFATADNSVADDNLNESNGLFTKHLLSALMTPGLDLKQVFERTKEAVYAASDHRQRPFTYDGVIGQYYFNGPVTIIDNSAPANLSAQEDIAFWNGVDKTDAQSLELYLRRFPEGRFTTLARRSLEKLRAPVMAESPMRMAAPVIPSPGGAKASPNAATPRGSGGLLNPALAQATAPPVFEVVFNTSKGDVTFEVHRDWAPNGADRFYNLVKIGFFDGAPFFRVIPGFMAQFGISANPAANKVWSNANIKDEPVKESNKLGYLSFAQSSLPNSRSTQLFINYKDNSRLDSVGFAPIGKVVEGLDVVEKFYSGYGGDLDQQALQGGQAYFEKNFPQLDIIKSARIMAQH